ncbi:hypothetical protein AVEN_240418-1 [Araneus ventricosus]|uniref:Uncharacterized protein n=1 Tax=Araneus ventricosus TaxID=182803 RepID=A0A4Y2L0L3_ARAVE|nr:hypothetical protein AVEN_240418-1 [Araneus ventricosus]
MYLFGITSLLPWNFFIQANDYWMYRFRNVSVPFDPAAEDKTKLQAIFSSYLAIASKVPYVIFLLVNAYVSNKLQPSKRIQWPLMAMIILFLFTTAIVFVDTDNTHQLPSSHCWRTPKTFTLQDDPSRSTLTPLSKRSPYIVSPAGRDGSWNDLAHSWRIFSPNGDIEKIPAPLRSHI